MFLILGFIDPDGRGTGKTDFPPLFFAIVDMLRPSHWFGDASDAGPFLVLRVVFELMFLGIYLVAVAFVSGFVGWLLQFVLTPLLPVRAQDADAVTVVQPLSDSGSFRIGGVRMALAAYGAGATIFGAVVSGLSGIQFWCVWFAYDRVHRATTGFHTWSSFHSLFLLLLVCALNAAGSAVLARRITSPTTTARLVAIVILGIQLSTLALSVNIFGLRIF